MQIKTKFPINVKQEDVFLFKKKESYTITSLKTKMYKNVFVNHWGLLLNNLVLPLKSTENLIGFYDHTFYFKHWKVAIEQFLVCKFGKSLQSIKIEDENIYFSIHTPWFGYFSWLTTYLPRLLEVSEKFPNAILLVPEEWDKLPFVQDSLSLFPSIQHKIIPNEHHMFVKNYLFSEVRPWTSIFYPEHISSVRHLFYKELEKREISIKPIKRIYVSRNKAERRKILNENLLEAYLIENEFEIVYFEDFTIFEQVFLMKNVEILVSMHGAGLTNTLFMQPNSILFELTPKLEQSKFFRFPFWRIASILKINYYIQFCKTINKGEADFYSRNIEIDIDEFKKNINSILRGN